MSSKLGLQNDGEEAATYRINALGKVSANVFHDYANLIEFNR